MTKAQLISVISDKDAELADLRSAVSVLSAKLMFSKQQAPTPAAPQLSPKRELMAKCREEAMRLNKLVRPNFEHMCIEFYDSDARVWLEA
jgi:hypothetical protein